MNGEKMPQPEPTIDNFLQAANEMMARWQAMGNVDVEPDLIRAIYTEIVQGKITPKEGIARLYAIDAGRIER